MTGISDTTPIIFRRDTGAYALIYVNAKRDPIHPNKNNKNLY